MSSLPLLDVLNSSLRSILESIEKEAKREDILRLIDNLENQIDMLLLQSAPERITDERFSVAIESLKETSKNFKALREAVSEGLYLQAKKSLMNVYESVKNLYRVMTLIKAGTPSPLVFQISPPQFLRGELPAPETLIYASPMGAQIYNILMRKNEESVDNLARELKIDDKTRDEFNTAVAYLISMGYAKPYFTYDGRTILKVVK